MLTEKDILEKDFKIDTRGYRPQEVDKFLDVQFHGSQEAVKEIDNIINVSDGIMIARGDLGLQIPMERIPGIQKNIINKCHESGKVCIVATELMSSMLNEIIPTRAEVSDIANAVLDGADAVTLSSETEYGKYPIESVNIMSKIIISAEQDLNNRTYFHPQSI